MSLAALSRISRAVTLLPRASLGSATLNMLLMKSATLDLRAGEPHDVKIEIVPVSRSTEFSMIVPRMENSEKRDFPIGNFRGRDGTPFNMLVVKPKAVRVSGTDINNKTVTVEVPWK